MKKSLLIVISLFLVVGLATGCGCSKKEEKKDKFNTNEKVIENKKVEDLTLTNTSLKVDKNYSTLVTLVSNPTGEDKEVRIFNIHVKDKKGNEIVMLQGYVGDVIPAGESREITSNVDMDLSNATDIEYEIVK